ncbi:MAG: 30S ribosomal protein S11 [bacterium]|nr:30S ribosomal protein S11 [bacterium]
MGKKRVAQKEGGEETVKETQKAVKPSKVVERGRIYIFSSYNNTIMSLTDEQGNTLSQVSAGAIGFKGTKKSTPFAASRVAETLYNAAKARGMQKIELFVKGVGTGRDSALRAFGAKDLEILSVRDVTPVPHNGPRARKVRRV